MNCVWSKWLEKWQCDLCSICMIGHFLQTHKRFFTRWVKVMKAQRPRTSVFEHNRVELLSSRIKWSKLIFLERKWFCKYGIGSLYSYFRTSVVFCFPSGIFDTTFGIWHYLLSWHLNWSIKNDVTTSKGLVCDKDWRLQVGKSVRLDFEKSQGQVTNIKW